MTVNAAGGGQRLGKSKDFSGADGVMSSDEMVAMMNDGALLMSSSVNGTVMKTGANRDADGTIDRSPPPTEAVKVLLKELKRTTDRYGIDMVSEFRTQGASQYGTISKSRFNSIITTTFGVEKDHLWDDAKLNVLAHHYGTGADDLHLGGKMQVAWMDFCEDVHRSVGEGFDDMYGVQGVAEALAFQRGAIISYRTLADVDDLIDDTLQKVAAEDVTGYVSANQVMEGRTRDAISITGAEARFN